MKATVIIIVLLAVVIAGYMLVSKQEKNTQNAMQSKSPQELSAELFSVLDEPGVWDDDQIHAVDWTRVLQLIEAGADIHKIDEYNRSIWKRVIMASVPNTAEVTPDEPVQHAKVVEALLKKGVSTEETLDEYNSTALLYASSEGYLPVVTVLLKYSADVNAVDNLGNSALLRASTPHQVVQSGFPPHFISTYNGHLQIIQSLLRAGADVNHRNKEGKTALSLAANSDENQVVIADELVDMLVESVQNNETPTPEFIPDNQDDITTNQGEKQKIIALLKSAGAKE